MVYCILSVLLILVVSFGVFYLTDDEDTASALASFTIMLVVVAPFVNCMIGIKEQEKYEETVYEITGLELHSSTEENIKGAFILGTGAVTGGSSTELQYVFFSNTEYGKKLEILKGTNVYIKETDEETPKLKIIKSRKYKELNWLDKLWNSDRDIIEYGTIEHGKILVVPTNTIKIDYNVEI